CATVVATPSGLDSW
nr:immunoglobulin heavy chain junction region [Macaca mulatta]MOV54818.1 immunoglobulin heavy chain junction region [Macaca mulatta]MOV54893.1 immunoglobulin heavy chain junction region [Macaca mulatta]MOV55052.1 immunoglobulin heavy chain junction region [Macaca mulatta]MOV55096.1 immunoglobulin heavy chain junction region [Macaca mulatta]